ncbi:unnamed protein product [Prorocentrum cordatum]|uniref:Pentatricopeptide repeat-containing protein, chloroplastic n=1 Tax=Prorocentrum cordatum TaxID=2364126 RepID=A0ABN9TCM5_9DINO|nr:unnamed protein product [Polarella glacialis]
MREASLEPDVISYNAGISACGQGEQWHRAVALLRDMWEAKLEPTQIQLQRWDQRVRERQTVVPGLAAAQRDVGGEDGARPLVSYNAGISACEKGEQWQRALALVGEMWEAKLEPDVISYSAGISACENGQQWQLALSLLSQMVETKLEPDNIIYNSGICACEKGQQWQRALSLLSEMGETKLEPDFISYNAGISACEKGRAVAAGAGTAERDVGGEVGA